MVSDKRKQFDFLFVVTVVPTDTSGGSQILYSIAKRLSDQGLNVGWVLFLNPYRFIYKVTRNPSLLPYVSLSATINILKSNVGFIFRNRLVKRTQNYERTLNGISILNSKSLKKVSFKRLIASAWETTYFVNHYNTESEKYNLIQYCAHEYLSDYIQGVDTNLVSQTFSFPLKKLVINETDLRKFGDDNPQKVQLGIDASKYYMKTPLDRRDGKTVLFPLRAQRDKGASIAIEAIKLIDKQRKDINIITFGNYGKTTMLPNRIDQRGFVDDNELFNLYNTASIFVIPSLLEGFCLPGLESMACGCAVISVDNIGIREYVKHNNNGIIVSPNDPNAIAKAVISLVENSTQRNNLIMNGFQTARTFSYENMARSFLTAIATSEQRSHKR
jgi:glycosyltransferase involved in cell wall biosynthesis